MINRHASPKPVGDESLQFCRPLPQIGPKIVDFRQIPTCTSSYVLVDLATSSTTTRIFPERCTRDGMLSRAFSRRFCMPCSVRTASSLVHVVESIRLYLVVARRLLGIAATCWRVKLNGPTSLVSAMLTSSSRQTWSPWLLLTVFLAEWGDTFILVVSVLEGVRSTEPTSVSIPVASEVLDRLLRVWRAALLPLASSRGDGIPRLVGPRRPGVFFGVFFGGMMDDEGTRRSGP